MKLGQTKREPRKHDQLERADHRRGIVQRDAVGNAPRREIGQHRMEILGRRWRATPTISGPSKKRPGTSYTAKTHPQPSRSRPRSHRCRSRFDSCYSPPASCCSSWTSAWLHPGDCPPPAHTRLFADVRYLSIRGIDNGRAMAGKLRRFRGRSSARASYRATDELMHFPRWELGSTPASFPASLVALRFATLRSCPAPGALARTRSLRMGRRQRWGCFGRPQLSPARNLLCLCGVQPVRARAPVRELPLQLLRTDHRRTRYSGSPRNRALVGLIPDRQRVDRVEIVEAPKHRLGAVRIARDDIEDQMPEEGRVLHVLGRMLDDEA